MTPRMAALRQLVDDLEEIPTHERRLRQADEAESVGCRIIQAWEGPPITEEVCSVVADWWEKTHQQVAGGPIQAAMHAKLAALEGIRHFARGGS